MHSVLSGVRCARCAYQVWPISTRRFFASTLKKRVQPTTSPVASRTTKGIASNRSRMSSAAATYSAIRSGAATDVYQSRHSSPSAAACGERRRVSGARAARASRSGRAA